MYIPHSRVSLDASDIDAVIDVLRSGNLAQGEQVRRFEEEVAAYVGVNYAVAVSSGTAALHLALESMGIGKDDEVIIPSYVCASLYMAILQVSARPVIIDIDRSSLNISLGAVESALTARTKAVIVPHMFGNPADLDNLLNSHVPIIEDCAQALGASYRDKKVGSLGEVAICSFYATKMITAGEGGMILTDDPAIRKKAVDMREYDKKSVNIKRFNYKMTDFQAALGINQVKKLDNFINIRRSIASLYNKKFLRINIKAQEIDPRNKSSYYRFVVLTKNVDNIRNALKSYGIICEKPVWKPLHKDLRFEDCPETNYVFEHALSIPLYPSLSSEEVAYVTEIFEKVVLSYQ